MNYAAIYSRLIDFRRINNPIGYCEKHHITPKCLGGDNNPSNLVNLTGREHFIAHVLLAKIHGGKLWMPVLRMKNRRGEDKYINSRLYEQARIEWSKWSSENQRGEKHWAYGKVGKNKGKKFPERSGVNSPLFGRPMSESTRLALKKSNTGSKRSEETKVKMGGWQKGENNNMYGKKMAEEHKKMLQEKMREWFKNATPEQLKARAKSRIGLKRSPESKAKMSAAQKNRFANSNQIAAVIESNKRRSLKK